MLSSGLGSTGLKAVISVLKRKKERLPSPCPVLTPPTLVCFCLCQFSLFPCCSIFHCFSPQGQCPWHVLQHICLKYARLQNLNFSTNGQYATLFTSLHSKGREKRWNEKGEYEKEWVKWSMLGNNKGETWRLVLKGWFTPKLKVCHYSVTLMSFQTCITSVEHKRWIWVRTVKLQNQNTGIIKVLHTRTVLECVGMPNDRFVWF